MNGNKSTEDGLVDEENLDKPINVEAPESTWRPTSSSAKF